MVKLKESHIQRSVLDYLSLKNIFHYRQNTGAFKRDDHFYQFGTKGSPDVVCVINGQYVGIECKSSTGKQSDSQKDFQEQLEKAGGKYLIVRSLEDLKL